MVEAIVDRIRMLFAWLTRTEYVPAPLSSRAAAEVSRVERKAEVEKEEDAPARPRVHVPPSLGQRVRMAAERMRTDRPIGDLLDPKDQEEARIIAWLTRYRLEALDAIASTPPAYLQMHVTGRQRHPGLPAMDEPQCGEPLSLQEWAAWLQNFERERGNSDPDPDRIYTLARILSDENYSLEEALTLARRGRAA